MHAYLLHFVTNSCGKYVLKLTSIRISLSKFNFPHGSCKFSYFSYVLGLYTFTLCASFRVHRSLHRQSSKIELSRIHAHFCCSRVPVLSPNPFDFVTLAWNEETSKEHGSLKGCKSSDFPAIFNCITREEHLEPVVHIADENVRVVERAREEEMPWFDR